LNQDIWEQRFCAGKQLQGTTGRLHFTAVVISVSWDKWWTIHRDPCSTELKDTHTHWILTIII